MKLYFRVNAILFTCLLFSACGQTNNISPSPLPVLTATSTFNPYLTLTPTNIVTPTPRPTYALPTLILTIDPALLPELLSNALSIQTLDINGNNTKRITGWDLGFAQWYCGGHHWLDANHILIYPASGEEQWGEGGGSRFRIASQPIVVNLDKSTFWAPPLSQPGTPSNCGRVDWSSKLKILITWVTNGDASTVSTYTYDGTKLAKYPGELSSISPSGTKILITENTLIDLQTNKKTNLNWSFENYYEPISWGHYWTSDETRIYRCCYFYADLVNGKSFRFKESDFLDS